MPRQSHDAVSNPNAAQPNAAVIDAEIVWFGKILDLRMKMHLGEADPGSPVEEILPPGLGRRQSPYADLVRRHSLDGAERLVLMLALLPHLRPELLDPFLIQNQTLGRRFTEFGGLVGQSHSGVLPTGETAMFLLAGADTGLRLRYRALFSAEHVFQSEGILEFDHRHQDEPWLSSALRLSPAMVETLTTGRPYHPPFSPDFPAQRIDTPLEWADLVLDPATRREIEDIVAWMRHEQTLMQDWGLSRRLKPGYRALFYGPPGTGKTLTASLLGKASGRSVYRVDLSKVVSKWIGETEKNLASLFDHAHHQNWILFFDEADSLFGKRTETRSSNDRAANQQVAYLLQRIEDFPGVVILATNLKNNLDEAFARRFQTMLMFRMPGPEERLRLWRDCFSIQSLHLGTDVDLDRVARDFELSGGSIINVLRYACLKAVNRKPAQIAMADLEEGVRRELHKDSRYFRG